ncbi:AAA family ATPase [Arhodomonas aquaeolei]|uniref:AAA family ATPase n=1 Tax=Arhodomonas aquaeolei TaxID=2369 RepID=UPI00216A486F|nr:AAA family ATPase [Arhodomonas aquaeolei]MCS4503862.1 AAA family ATPase [Arhodomonas aquaeolei]
MSDNISQFPTQPEGTEGDLRAEAQRVSEAEGLSLTELSQLTGVHKTRLSQWLKGKYAGNNASIEADVRRWLESRRASQELEGQLPAAPTWVETLSARSVLSALSFAQMAEAVSVIYGGAGTGKTTTVRQYQEQAPNVWVVTATPASASTGPILKRIAQTLGMRTSGTVDQLEANIIDRVRDTRGLLVIDEAQHLTHRALDAVRSIHDAADIGLALVGNEIVYSQLTGGSRSVGFAQLFSRVAKRVRLAKAKDADVLALVDAWGIQDKDSRQLCLSIGRRPGALRGLSQTLRLASMFATTAGAGRPGVEHIRDAWADLGGEA